MTIWQRERMAGMAGVDHRVKPARMKRQFMNTTQLCTPFSKQWTGFGMESITCKQTHTQQCYRTLLCTQQLATTGHHLFSLQCVAVQFWIELVGESVTQETQWRA